MIIINGDIKTPEIKSCRYNPATKTREVEYINSPGTIYSYGYLSVEWLSEPQILNSNMYRISKDGQEFFDIKAIYVFSGQYDTYLHICFGDGSERDYCQGQLQISESCLLQSRASNVFNYIKQIANLSDLKNETGEKILAKRFAKISFVGNDVALA